MPNTPTTRNVLAWLLAITRPVHGPLLISLACRVLNLIVDLTLFAVAAGAVVTAVTDGINVGRLLAILAALALAKAGMFYLEQFSGHYVAFKALELLRTQVFSSLLPQAPSIVTHARSGDLLASLTRDVDRIEVVYAHTFAPVVSAYILGAGAMVLGGLTLGWHSIWIAAACLAFSLLIVPALGWRSAARATRQAMATRRDLSHHVTDSVFGIEVVTGYGIEAERLAELDAYGERISQSATRARSWVGLRRAANTAAMLLAAASVVYLGLGHLDLVTLAAAVAVILRVFEAPRGIEDAVGYLDHSLAAARRLYEISQQPPVVVDGPRTLTATAGMAVEFRSVSYTYPSRDGAPVAPAVTDISWRIPAGGHGALVGRSGSGKSTLMQLLQRYDDPRSGQILLDGQPLTSYTLDSLRSAIVAVNQRPQLIGGTIADNLRLGAPDASDEELWAALAVADLATQIAEFPDALHTHAGRGHAALSGGQIQRLALARALLTHPAVLILDEFTANLGVAQARKIRDNLAAYLPGVTVIEVTHRLEAIGDADTIAVIDGGTLLAHGTSEDITIARIRELFSA